MVRVGFLELLALLVAPLLAPLFYWRILTANPRDVATFPFGDFTDLHYPYRRWVAEQLARGEAPFWNQFVSAGQSAVGDIQFHVFYPPDSWLAQYAGGGFPLRTLELDVVGHVALATLLTYLFARRLTASRLGGLVAAIVFGFGGYLAGFPVQQVILLETSVWLPLILLCIDLGADLNLVSAFVVGAGALALAALAGHPQTLFYVGLTALLYLSFKAYDRGRLSLATIPGLPILFLGGAGLAAAALMPAYLHLALTDRTDVSYAFSSTGFALHEAIGVILPVQFGGAALYCGSFTLLLVAVGLASATRRANKLFWVGVAIFGLLLSFGGATFLQSVSYLLLGAFKFRDYERLSLVFDFAVAVLAGYGAAELASSHDLRLGWLRRAIAWTFAVLLVFGVFSAAEYVGAAGNAQVRLLILLDRLAFTALVLGLGAALVFARDHRHLKPALAGVLAVLLVAFDLFSTNWQNNLRPGRPAQLLASTPIVSYLENDTAGLFRIASEGLLPGDGNAGDLLRLQDVVGNSPLETRAYADFTTQVPELARWQILDVRYVVTKRKIDDPRLHLLVEDNGANLYQLDDKVALRRVYVVHRTISAPDRTLAFDLIKDTDLRTTAVVEGAAPVLDGSKHDDSTVRFTSYQANALSLTAVLRSPGLLVLSEIDYPGWHAEVDGRPAPIYRADGIVRSVYLPAGSHVIRFWFDPPGLSQGQAISHSTQQVLIDVVIAEIALRIAWWALHRLPRRWRHPGLLARRRT